MSDKANKAKPKVERVARLEGVTTYRDPRDGFSLGSSIGITDQDVAAAIALSRAKKPDGSVDKNDVGPECLETFFGSTQRHRRLLVNSYLRATSDPGEAFTHTIIRRMAATLSAQRLAGMTFSRAQWSEYAYIVRCRRETLEDESRKALYWFQDRGKEARVRFQEVLETRLDLDAIETAAAWQEMRDAKDREERIKAKLYKRAS